MTFEELLDQAIALLQRRGRLTYRALKRQFALDDDALAALTAELLYAHPQVRDDAGHGLLWTGEEGVAKVLMCYDRYPNERNQNTRMMARLNDYPSPALPQLSRH